MTCPNDVFQWRVPMTTNQRWPDSDGSDLYTGKQKMVTMRSAVSRDNCRDNWNDQPWKTIIHTQRQILFLQFFSTLFNCRSQVNRIALFQHSCVTMTCPNDNQSATALIDGIAEKLSTVAYSLKALERKYELPSNLLRSIFQCAPPLLNCTVRC